MASESVMAAACFAVDPSTVGGIWLRTDRGARFDEWLQCLRRFLDPIAVRTVPAHIDDERLLGGIDLSASLRCGRAVFLPGLLEQARGEVIMLTLAERLPPRLAASMAAALEPSCSETAGFGVIALEGARDESERCPQVLTERLALHINLYDTDTDADVTASRLNSVDVDDIAHARTGIALVEPDDAALHVLCAAALSLGIESLRSPLFALRVARLSAALQRRRRLEQEDLELATRLVLAPRTRSMPQSEQRSSQSSTEPDATQSHQGSETIPGADEQELAERIIAAARSAIPPGLLNRLGNVCGASVRPSGTTSGRKGSPAKEGHGGRAIGVRSGHPGGRRRLNIWATLTCAAPWQQLRRNSPVASGGVPPNHLLLRSEDFRITRYRQRTQSLTLFVLDASGSSAMHRLAELKGAVELLLSDCYARRDQVAVVAFRGRTAQLVLPPTRSLLRARRCLSGLPGGGGTPLASGLRLARECAERVRKRGLSVSLVILTDGQANVQLDGQAGRESARQQALNEARALRAGNIACLLIDTAPRPQAVAGDLAAHCGAMYLPLPHADALSLREAVRAAG